MEEATPRPTTGGPAELVISLAMQALTSTDVLALYRQACRGLALYADAEVHLVERDASGVLLTRVSTEDPPTDPDELMRSTDALVLPIADGGPTRRLIVQPAPTSARAVGVARQVAEILEGASKRHRRESALQASEARLQMAQELAGLGSYDWEIQTDTNTWSDELFRIYGSEPGSFNASYEKFLSLLHPDDRETVQEVHRKAFETMSPYQMEERIIRPNGDMRILKSNGVVIPDEHGQPARMAGICYDITELRAAEEDRRRLHDASIARAQALAINDSIVQGLATGLGHLRLGDVTESELFLVETLSAARAMMDDLLSQTKGERDIAAGDFLRDEPARVTGFSEPRTSAEQSDGPTVTIKGARGPGIRVVVADDTAEMRRLTRHILESDSSVKIVGEAATGHEAIQMSGTLLPDVLILDLAMPVMDGLTAIPGVLLSSPDTQILVMTGYGTEVGETALAAGAHGFIEKGAPMDSLRAEVARLGRRVVAD